MKTRQIIILLFLPLLLIACVAKQDTSSIQPSIYTAVAQTLTANPTRTPPGGETAVATATAEEVQLTATQPPAEQPTLTQVIATSVYSDCNEATYVSDVTIPDNTVLSAGESFTKTWSVKNVGTCTWSTSYALKFVSGAQMSGSATNLTQSVAPQTSVQVSVKLVAPSTPGTYTGYWQMSDESGTNFGESLYLKIIIAATPTGTRTITGTITATPTITPTRTNTPIYIIITATPGPTNTLAPTAVPTSTSAPSKTPKPTAVPSKTPVPTEVPTSVPPTSTPEPPTEVPSTETPVPTA